MARKSGSERRKRGKVRTMRFSPAEDAAIEKMSRAAGYSFSGLVRHALFENAPPPTRPHPGVDEQALARLFPMLAAIKAEAGKHGSNINQIARQINIAGPDAGIPRVAERLDEAIDLITTFYERDVAEIRLGIMKALGFERGEPED